MKYLILINGPKRSGKDYTADLFHQGTGASTLSFADPLKQIVADTFDISREDLEEFKNNSDMFDLVLTGHPNNQEPFKVFDTDMRTVLQRFGTEAMKKQFGDNVWAKRAVELAIDKKDEFVVIPDFRFTIEHKEAFKAAQENGFKLYTIYVQNDDLDLTDMHSSEKELSDNKFEFHYTIDNTGQPDDIGGKVQTIINDIYLRDE